MQFMFIDCKLKLISIFAKGRRKIQGFALIRAVILITLKRQKFS